MCELLGINFNTPVRCTLSLARFSERGKGNPHGWGIACFHGEACQVIKEPLNAKNSALADFLHDYAPLRSDIFIAHVRKRSQGEVALKNTHPFTRVFRGREVVFAHNGTINDTSLVMERRALHFHPVGDTDSEYLFCALLTIMAKTGQNIALDDFPAIEAVLKGFNLAGTMNIIFSDGASLYCYRDGSGHNGLWVANRQAPFDEGRLTAPDGNIILTDEKSSDQKGVIVATQPLTKENWTHLAPGRLHVFKGGERIFGAG